MKNHISVSNFPMNGASSGNFRYIPEKNRSDGLHREFRASSIDISRRTDPRRVSILICSKNIDMLDSRWSIPQVSLRTKDQTHHPNKIRLPPSAKEA